MTRAPIPAALSADPMQLEAVRPIIEGRSCLIVGSAPRAIRGPEPARPGELVIAINGGISSTAGTVPLWIVGSKPYDGPGHPVRELHRAMLDQALDRWVAHAVFLRQPGATTEGLTLEQLTRRRCRIETYSVLDKPTKRALERDYCARASDKCPCSSGILAVALAFHVGAAAVRLAGFSLAPGYHYFPGRKGERWWRDHVEADRRALVTLSARYGARLEAPILEAVTR